ncbi:MAG: hypothetical protein K8J09_02495 [Planctomycetes bacterium]|nr:hypothetical protein [Planctomycetota bacterium]MCC7399482.1 hypothetical protein [Planctomycetota bacterium]
MHRSQPFPFLLPWSLAVLSFATGLMAQQGDQPKGLPNGEAALTHKRHDAARTAFWQQQLAASCQAAAGLDDADKAALTDLLHVCAQVISRDSTNLDLRPAAGAHARLAKVDSDDPVLRLAMLNIEAVQNSPQQVAAAFAALEAKLDVADGPPAVRLVLAELQFGYYLRTGQAEGQRHATARRAEALVALAGTTIFDADAQRFFFDAVQAHLGGDPKPDAAPLLDRLDKAAGKPVYALLVLRAALHNGMAWAARGTGAAASVTGSDRERFADNLQKAAEFAQQACEIGPHFPEAPTVMLKVLGAGGSEVAERRFWFDRAVAAQFDYRDAYMTYLHYLQPRWGGSARALLDFAGECLDTARFDTEVPWNYLNAVHYVALDSREPRRVWGNATVQKRLEECLRGYQAAPHGARLTAVIDSRRIAALALGGRAEEAAQVYESSGKQLDARAIQVFGIDEAWLLKTLRPHLKDYQPVVVPVTDLFAGWADTMVPAMAKARPLTGRERAITRRQAGADFDQWLRDVYTKAYEDHGHHDAKWDADARALYAVLPTIIGEDIPEATSAIARRLQDSDCDDPLTLCTMMRALPDESAGRRIKTLTKVVPEVVKQHSPPIAWWAEEALWVIARSGGRPDIGAQMMPRFRARMVVATTDAAFAGAGRRHFVRCVWGRDELVPSGNLWFNDDMVDQLGSLEGAEPWCVEVVTGLCLLKKARYPKGSTEQRWSDARGAAKHLREAYEMHPECPEAAAGMIHVAMLDAATAGASAREWFDRAVDAEFDYEPAYRAYVEALRPLFGGSIQAMYHFAEQCLDSERFDTRVPMWYVWTLQRIQQEQRGAREVWAAEGVPGRLERLFRGYEKQVDAPFDAMALASLRVVTAWAGGRYPQAAAAWGAARQLDASWLTVVSVSEPDLVMFDLEQAAKAR